MMQALITGAHGFIGRHLSGHLSSMGYQVLGIGHGEWTETEAFRCGVSRWFSGEISADNLMQIKKQFGAPDLIFHLAGGSSVGSSLINPYEDFVRTVQSTAVFLEWIRNHAKSSKVIAISSAAVYGDNHEGSVSELDLTRPSSPYGAHKLMMEQICRSYGENFGLNIVIPRLFSVYGVDLKKQLLWDICGKLSKKGDLRLGGTGRELRDWVHVSDVVRALVEVSKMADHQAPAINIGTGMPISVETIARLVIDAWYCKNELSPALVFNQKTRAGDPHTLVADNKRMKDSEISLRYSIADGLAEYVSWYKKSLGSLF